MNIYDWPLASQQREPFACAGHNAAGEGCRARMNLFSNPYALMPPFFYADLGHAPGCDEGASLHGEAVAERVRGVLDGAFHDTSEWKDALAAYLEAGPASFEGGVTAYLGQWNADQWDAWATYRNNLAAGEIETIPGLPQWLVDGLRATITPADFTAPMPLVGVLRCEVHRLLAGLNTPEKHIRLEGWLCGGPLFHELRVNSDALALSPDDWRFMTTALLVPQSDGFGVQAHVIELEIAPLDHENWHDKDLDLFGVPVSVDHTGKRTWRWSR